MAKISCHIRTIFTKWHPFLLPSVSGGHFSTPVVLHLPLTKVPSFSSLVVTVIPFSKATLGTPTIRSICFNLSYENRLGIPFPCNEGSTAIARSSLLVGKSLHLLLLCYSKSLSPSHSAQQHAPTQHSNRGAGWISDISPHQPPLLPCPHSRTLGSQSLLSSLGLFLLAPRHPRPLLIQQPHRLPPPILLQTAANPNFGFIREFYFFD